VTDLISWEKVRDYLSIREDHEEVTTMIIGAVSTQARKIMGRVITQTSLSEIRKGNGSRIILLKEFPVLSVTALFIDLKRAFLENTKIPESAFFLDKAVGKIELYNSFFPSHSNGYSIKIDYEAGFTDPPEDIQLAVLETIRWNYNRITLNGVGVRREEAEGITQSFEITVPTNAKNIFNSYRRVNV